MRPETKGDKRRQTSKSFGIKSLQQQITMETDGDKPPNHDGTGCIRRKTKGDKHRNHDGTSPSSLN